MVKGNIREGDDRGKRESGKGDLNADMGRIHDKMPDPHSPESSVGGLSDF